MGEATLTAPDTAPEPPAWLYGAPRPLARGAVPVTPGRNLAAVAAPPGNRVVDVLAQLEPADVACLPDMLVDLPWLRVRQQRFAERDEVIRQAVRSLGSCRAMAAEL